MLRGAWGFALLAPAIAARAVVVDTNRTFVVGFSGGGRVASMMMPAYPGRFAGAVFICGANPLVSAAQAAIDELGRLPMVFLTGTGDFNLEDTRLAFSTYLQAGVTRAQLIVVDNLDHALPGEAGLDAALEFLDAPSDDG